MEIVQQPQQAHSSSPSSWVLRFAPALPAGARILDLACGYGRHALFLEAAGSQITALDRNPEALASLRGHERIEILQADLESGPWPLGERRFDAVVVTHYLHRPLFAHLQRSLQDGGLLLYETFMLGNERYGRPSNPQFLLRPGELLTAFPELEIVAFEQGVVRHPKPACVQRLCARRGGARVHLDG